MAATGVFSLVMYLSFGQKNALGCIKSVVGTFHQSYWVPDGASLVINTPSSDPVIKLVLKSAFNLLSIQN